MAPPAKYRWGQWNLVAGLQHFLQPRTERCFGGTQRLVREGLKQAQVSLVMLLIEPHVLLEQVGHRDDRALKGGEDPIPVLPGGPLIRGKRFRY